MVKSNILKLIKSSLLYTWDCKRYFDTEIQSKYVVERLEKHIVEETEKIKPFNNPDGDFYILGVANDKGMFDAYVEKGKNIKQAYKKVKDGYIAYNPYRVNVGSIGIKTKDLQHNLISPAYIVFSCRDTVLPEYIFLLMKTNVFNKLIRDNTTGSVRQILSFERLKNILIPVPSLSEQKKLVEKYNRTMQQADECEKKAEEIGNNIDEKILNLFGCKVPKVKQNADILHFKKLSELLNWGVDLNFSAISPQNIFMTNKFYKKFVSEIAEINPQTEYPKSIENITFLPMECISDLYGEIAEKRQGTVSQTKGYTKFQDDDVLWAKITPCMQNGKSAVAKGLLNGYGYGSTEYYVIRVDKKQVIPEYVYCFLRMKLVRNIAQTYFSGSAGQQRVRKEFLENLAIPIIPIKSPNSDELTQEKMVSMVFDYQSQMRGLNEKSLVLRQQAQQEFEEAVFSEA